MLICKKNCILAIYFTNKFSYLKTENIRFMGAGGTSGGTNRFMIGFIMMVAGGYLLLNSIHISNSFGLGHQLYNWGGVGITTGYVLIPFMFGVGMIFYDAKNFLGWVLMVGSVVMLIFGVITSIQFRMERMSAFQLMTILVLLIGGVGLFLSSFRKYS